MIVCALFTIAGIIAMQNSRIPPGMEATNFDAVFFLIAGVCFGIAGLAGVGVIGQS